MLRTPVSDDEYEAHPRGQMHLGQGELCHKDSVAPEPSSQKNHNLRGPSLSLLGAQALIRRKGVAVLSPSHFLKIYPICLSLQFIGNNVHPEDGIHHSRPRAALSSSLPMGCSSRHMCRTGQSPIAFPRTVPFEAASKWLIHVISF